MASWENLPFELKSLITRYFLEGLLAEYGQIATVGCLALKRTMCSRVDDLLEAFPEMRLEMLARCRKRGVELEWEEKLVQSEYNECSSSWIELFNRFVRAHIRKLRNQADLAFRLEWHICVKDRRQKMKAGRRTSPRLQMRR